MVDPRGWGVAVLAGVGLMLAPAAAATEEEGCDVQAAVELDSREPSDDAIRLVFDVRLEASCACASATYDLVLEELLPNKQWKAVRETRRVDLRDARATDRVEHLLSKDIELIGYSVKPVESTPCG